MQPQHVVNRTGWVGGNALVIIQEHVSGAERRAYTVNSAATKAPILRIKVAGQFASGGTGTKTVRQKLKEIIAGFDHLGHTPIVSHPSAIRPT